MVLGAVCVAAGLLAGGWWWHAHGPRQPALLPGGLVVEQVPAQLDIRDARANSAWRQCQELRRHAEALAGTTGGSRGDLQFWDLAAPKEKGTGIRWRIVALHNPGFAPRAVFEHPARGGNDRLLGFFAADDGRPLSVARRRPGNTPTAGKWLLQVMPPLVPGETRPVIQVERLPAPVKAAAGSRGWDVRWPGGNTGRPRPPVVQLRALRLPENATWTLHPGTPEPDLLKGEPPVLFWTVKAGEAPPTISLTAQWPDN